MIQRRGNRNKSKNKKNERVYYHIDANGNWTETKESTRTLADVKRNFKGKTKRK